MNINPYWECTKCHWVGIWGDAHESIVEDWEGHVTFFAYCPKCGNEVKNISKRFDD